MTFPARRLLCVLLLICLLLSCVGCETKPESLEPHDTVTVVDPIPDLPGGESEPDTPEPENPEDPEEEKAPEGNFNPLTGLCDSISDAALESRPVAVMVSNIITSLPQWGVSDADILFEMLAEGRITRLMAIYQDPAKIDHIASIRSARPYFIDMAQSYGAVYVHFGGSVPAYEAIATRKDLVSLDGIKGSWEGTVFFRDPDRKAKLGLEHSVYTSGELLQKAFVKLDADMTQKEHPSAFTFAEHHSAEQGRTANKVQVSFSENHKPYFEYDSGTGTYLRYEYGAKHIDGWTNKQIAVKNLLVLHMDTTDVPNSALHLIEIRTTGSGAGYYFCDGKYVPVIWKKDAYNGELKILDTENQEIVFAPGQTFICCCTASAAVNIT